MRWLLLAAMMAFCSSANAAAPFLEEQTYGRLSVTSAEGFTVVVSSVSLPISVTNSTEPFVVHMNYGILEAGVTVSGGTGFTVTAATGTLAHCAIVPPSTPARYDFRMTVEGPVQYPIMGRIALADDVSVMARRVIVGAIRIKIENATPDGVYNIRCTFRE